MSRSKSSQRWLQEHFSDQFVQKSQTDSYRSRAVYKLIQLDQKDRLIQPGMVVVELGAAPGGWTQYVAEQAAGPDTRIIASDILPMDSFAGVDFIQGDFTTEETLAAITERLQGRQADLVLSDMAPNFSGVAVTDQARAMHLAELALELAREFLQPQGIFVTKLFQGAGFDPFIADCRNSFQKVVIRKPAASRDRSREVYAVARNLIL